MIKIEPGQVWEVKDINDIWDTYGPIRREDREIGTRFIISEGPRGLDGDKCDNRYKLSSYYYVIVNGHLDYLFVEDILNFCTLIN